MKLSKKEEYELNWQRTEWAPQFTTPHGRAKVLEYWRRFRFFDEIVDRVRPQAQTRILDVGCGLSTVLHFLPGRRTGVDPLADEYKRFYDYPPDINIRRAYGEDLPLADASFDLVLCSNCIDHVADPSRTIAEITRVLRPGGHFVLTCEVYPADKGERCPAHPHTMTKRKLMALVAHFELLEHWQSRWTGLKYYVDGRGPTRRFEHILLLCKEADIGNINRNS